MTDIRRATPADAAALHELAAETFPLAVPPGTTADDVAAFIAEHLSEERFHGYLADPVREIYVAEASGLIGYTMLVYGEPTDPDVAAALTARPTVELSKCYARAAHHGAGIAASLVEASIAGARERGAAAMWLGVSQENARANAFYGKQGFAQIGFKTFRVGAELHDDFTRERVLG